MAKVVGGELRFPPWPDAHFGTRHNGGVVDEQVERLGRSDIVRRELSDRFQVSEIEFGDLDIGNAASACPN